MVALGPKQVSQVVQAGDQMGMALRDIAPWDKSASDISSARWRYPRASP